MSDYRSFRSMVAGVLALCSAGLLAGCDTDTGSMENARAYADIPEATLKVMAERGTSKDAPMLIRAYKKEAELEVWKKGADGKYVFVKMFPMCRWSGQLGPKTTEGDRQVPEGFYTIAPGQMNPNSHYYLSFNVGYPNAYDRANGHTGGSIMVHGICSSAGCFSMTDRQIEEIYAIARESFAGGQRAIQMQSFPFHMTAENMAKMRLDPNIAFWREIKQGSDYFDVTKEETPVGVCNKHYVFGATPKEGRFDALSACPPMTEDPAIKREVAAKEAKDNAEIAALVTKGAKAVRIVYADGGQNASFAHQFVEVSRPDALAEGPTEIVLDMPKSKSAAVQIAAAKAQSKALLARGNVITSNVAVAEGSAKEARAAALVAAANTPAPVVAGRPASGAAARPQPTQVAARSVVPATFNAAPSAYATTPAADDQGNVISKWLNFGHATKPEAAPVVQAAAALPAPAQAAIPAATRRAKAGAHGHDLPTGSIARGAAAPAQTQVAQSVQPAAPAPAPATSQDGQGSFLNKWLNFGSAQAPQTQAQAPVAPAVFQAASPAATPTTPKKTAASRPHDAAPARAAQTQAHRMPKEITGDRTAALPAGALALAPDELN